MGTACENWIGFDSIKNSSKVAVSSRKKEGPHTNRLDVVSLFILIVNREHLSDLFHDPALV